MRALLSVIGAIASASVVACAVPEPEPGLETTSSAASAVVVVERTAGPGDAVRGDAVVARFIRVKQGAVDEPALRIAGAAMDVPPPGACFAPSDGAPLVQGRSVELLDVGQVVISQPTEAAAKGVVLLPRTMPDPAGVVSGVFYSSRSPDAFEPGAPVSLRSSGGPDLLDGFSVSVMAPREVGEVLVTSTPAGLELGWDATEAEPHDLVYVDVLSPAPRVVVRCAGADLGHLVVPQASLAGVEDGQLAVHRLRKESFKAKGIEPGEVRFDVAKIVTFRR